METKKNILHNLSVTIQLFQNSYTDDSLVSFIRNKPQNVIVLYIPKYIKYL